MQGYLVGWWRALRNSECAVYVTTRRGYVQRYRREKDGWTQTSPNGKVRRLSAEQLLSHILPCLAGIGSNTVRVEADWQKKPGAV